MVRAIDKYTGIVFDLDGVVYEGDQAIRGVPAALSTLSKCKEVVFATNNATKTPQEIQNLLGSMGIAADPVRVVTSAVVASQMLPSGNRCLIIGMNGLKTALRDQGCVEVHDPQQAETVVVGWDRELVWDDLRRAALALQGGARFLATNGDVNYPTREGLWPGNGAILAALSAATGRLPEIAGKPEAPMFEAAAALLPRGPLLMVGDSPETDLAGASSLGWDTALVLSGRATASDVLELNPRPTFVVNSVVQLLELEGDY